MFHSSTFTHGYKIHSAYSPSFPFPCAHPTPTGTHPQKRPIFPSSLHLFFNVYIDNPRGYCHGTSGLYISCFNQINPLPQLFTNSLSPCCPNIQQLTVQCIMLNSYVYGLFQYFSFSNNFVISPASGSPFRQSHWHYFVLSLTIYICIFDHICIYICIYIYI
jgi:hypothetical protein